MNSRTRKIAIAILIAVIAIIARLYLFSDRKLQSSSLAEAPPAITSASSPKPTVSQKSPPQASSIQETPTRFEEKLKTTQASLPTVDQVREDAKKDPHGHPPVLETAAESLGQIAEAVSANARLGPQAQAFYRQCAERNDLATSVRAVCFSDFQALARKNGSNAGNTALQVPQSVKDLAEKIDGH